MSPQITHQLAFAAISASTALTFAVIAVAAAIANHGGHAPDSTAPGIALMAIALTALAIALVIRS